MRTKRIVRSTTWCHGEEGAFDEHRKRDPISRTPRKLPGDYSCGCQRRHGQVIGVEDERADGVLNKFLEPVSESWDAGTRLFTACRGLDILYFFDFLSGAMRLCDGPHALPEFAA